MNIRIIEQKCKFSLIEVMLCHYREPDFPTMMQRLNVAGPLLRAAATQGVEQQQQRGMATLKAISIRLKSVKNIQKITQSMKMVSAAK